MAPASLEIYLALMEKQAARLRAITPHINDSKAQEECRQLAKEAEDEAQNIRQQLEELGAEDV